MTVLKAYEDIESEVMRRIARVYRSTTDKVRMKSSEGWNEVSRGE